MSSADHREDPEDEVDPVERLVALVRSNKDAQLRVRCALRVFAREATLAK